MYTEYLILDMYVDIDSRCIQIFLIIVDIDKY